MGATFPISAGLRRAFIGASEVAVSQPRFLLAFFGGFPNAMKSVETEYIESDLFKTKVRVAKFVNPDAVAKGTEKLTFVEQQIKLPTIKDKRSLTSKEMRSKGFGETIYDSSSNQTRVAAAMDTELVDMDSTIMNRLELMAIESIFDGRMTIIGEGENRIIDYSRKTGLSIDLGAGNYYGSNGGTPNEDFDDFIALLGENGYTATHVVGRLATMKVLANHTAIKSEIDNRRIENGNLRFQSMMKEKGAIYYGMYKNCELWGYDGNYVDNAGVSQKAVPAKKIAFIAAETDNTIIPGYAGDMHIDSGALSTESMQVSIAADKKVQKIHVGGDISAPTLELYMGQTVAPIMPDADCAVVVQILA